MHKKQVFSKYQHCDICAHVSSVLLVFLMSLFKILYPIFQKSLSPLLFRKHTRDCVGIMERQKVKVGSHTGGVFGVSWHLGERFQLIWDPRVHFDGFAGEQQPDIVVQVYLSRFGALESKKNQTKNRGWQNKYIPLEPRI